jgi:hypothetical protein
MLVVSPLLWNLGMVYQVAAVAQLAFYGLALAGLVVRGTRLQRLKFLSVPFYFCMVNAAALVATANVLRGNRILLWEPQRNDSPGWARGNTVQR